MENFNSIMEEANKYILEPSVYNSQAVILMIIICVLACRLTYVITKYKYEK